MVATICVPDEGFVRCLPADIAARALIWSNFRTEPPFGIEHTTMLVVPHDSPLPTAGMLSSLPSLQAIQLLSHGFERWSGLVPEGVELCVARGLHTVSTAEMAVSLLLYRVLDVPRLVSEHERHEWHPSTRGSLLDRRVLILGAGDIGTLVARTVRALGATATLVGKRARNGVLAVEEVAHLLPAHDALVITAPLTAETKGMVDKEFLATLPDGAILVNVARGAIIDTEALIAELSSRRISACLDVTDPEPLPADHPLWRCPNLLITAHLGGETRGWRNRARILVAEQVARHADNRPLNGRVSIERSGHGKVGSGQ